MTSHEHRAAFEISKGVLPLLFLSEADVIECLDPGTLLAELAGGFESLERGEVQSPARPEIVIPGKGFSLSMPAWRPGGLIGVKVVNVFDSNLELGLPNHLAMITLFDPVTGATVCVMDGTYITALRTAASAILSVDLLARHDARVATVIGAGVQAREHLLLLPRVRNLARINVCSLYDTEAARLAELSPIGVAPNDVRAAVEESDIVCLATHSADPVIESEWVRAGTHVTSVGYHPPNGELPRDLSATARLYVESLAALEPSPTGCADLDHLSAGHATPLGAVVINPDRGRISDTEITVYKAMGLAMEDLIAANLAYQSAVRLGRGTTLDW
jgi:alanine dehydrogenase